MKNKMIIAALASVVAVMQLTSPVMAAQTTEQHQEQKASGKCNNETTTTTSYGQSSTTVKSNCDLELEQKQHQKMLRENGIYHKPVDTALDAKMTATLIGMMLIAVAAYVANKRIA